ncbi:MAG: class I SAM-dependent methyltransferase, partial [Sulfurimonas sp.]|nr:class I SAM-dependent methyltransferase [Sulfurimonas sp.]
MFEDKEKWNKKYLEFPMPEGTSHILEKYVVNAVVGQALDIACGTGRNAHFLADKGFVVDAVDFSDYALSKVKNSSTIKKIEADLDKYNITPKKYDLIVNINYLNRRLVSQLKDAIKEGGF